MVGKGLRITGLNESIPIELQIGHWEENIINTMKQQFSFPLFIRPITIP